MLVKLIQGSTSIEEVVMKIWVIFSGPNDLSLNGQSSFLDTTVVNFTNILRKAL
jgi:hypothetical protein